MFRNTVASIIFAACATAATAMPLDSKHVLVVDEDSGTVLLEKNAAATVPIASLTKLMTAMVVLDAQPDMEELICIDDPDVVTKRRRNLSRLPLGTWLPRKTVLQLALMSSDNRAAASLAQAYPGGDEAFVAAVEAKIVALGMEHTRIEEPTGLSPNNRSTAADLVKMARVAAQYPEIARITTDSRDSVAVNGRTLEYHNTNRLVGKKGWGILLSKTGTTTPAGRCLIMRLQSAGRTFILVLLHARGSTMRIVDATRIRRFVDDHGMALTQAAARAVPTVAAVTERRGDELVRLARAEVAQ